MRLPGGIGRTPIGVDLGTRQIKAIQLGQGRGGWRVEAAASFARPGEPGRIDPLTVSQLPDVFYRKGFRGNNVVLAAPGDALRKSVLELPGGGPNIPVDQISRLEMARMHKLDPGGFELVSWVLPEPDRSHKTTHVMATACPHEDADRLLDTFEDQGLNVCALDIGACALARANTTALKGPDRIVSILDLGWQAARLVVMNGSVIAYERTLEEAGLGLLHRSLSAQFGNDSDVAEHVLRNVGLAAQQPDPSSGVAVHANIRHVISSHFEAMLNELLTSLSYVSRQYGEAPLDSLLLAGSGASVPGVTDYLEAMLGTQVRSIAPSDLVECKPSLLNMCKSPSMTMAMGLALFSDRK